MSAWIGVTFEGAGIAALGTRAAANALLTTGVSVGQTAVLNNIPTVPSLGLHAHKDSYTKSILYGALFGAGGSVIGDLAIPAAQWFRQPSEELDIGTKIFALHFQEFNEIDPRAGAVVIGQSVGAVLGSGQSFIPLERETGEKTGEKSDGGEPRQ